MGGGRQAGQRPGGEVSLIIGSFTMASILIDHEGQARGERAPSQCVDEAPMMADDHDNSSSSSTPLQAGGQQLEKEGIVPASFSALT